ncbi:MAG: amidohydrolase family protein [Candidatus Jordarchaeaceae archaeon]
MIFLLTGEDKIGGNAEVEPSAPQRTVSFYVVDAHTHIGREEVLEYGKKAYRTNNPKLTLDFYQRLQFEVMKAMKVNFGKYCFVPSEPFTKPPPLLGMLQENAPGIRSIGWTVDKFVAFPFNDTTAYNTSPSFQLPNEMVLSRGRVLPYSLRMLGFVRVDPHEGEKAIEEVVRCSQRGARGLKLHPISQKFLGAVTSENVRNVVVAAARNGLPVLFDCRYYSTAEDIYHLTQEVRQELGGGDFAVIVGHSGMEYTRDELYEFFKDPCIYAETSGVRGYDVPLFFKKMKKYVPNWSSKIVFGTDYNYFSLPQATDFLSYLFTKEFRDEIGGTPQDIQRILGGNLLSIIKPFTVSPIEGGETSKDGKLYRLPSEYADAFLKILSLRISSLIAEKRLTYVTYDVLLSPNFDLDYESFVLNLSRKATASQVNEVIVVAKIKDEAGEFLNVCNLTGKLLQVEEDFKEETPQKTILNNKLYTKLIHEIVFSGNQEEIKTREEAEKLPKILIP